MVPGKIEREALRLALEHLKDVVNQACYDGDVLDSMALSAYSEALRYLERIGEVEIIKEYGRRVIAKWCPAR